MHLLFVDDDQACLETLVDIARASGHTVATAPDGATCLDMTSREPFERIFLDISLPDADGRDICRRIRAGGACRNARIIALTGDSDVVKESGNSDFDGYLLKPLSLRTLELFLLP